MSISWNEACRAVRTQAEDRCAYCRMHQSLQGSTFHVEPHAEGGSNDPENLCLACPGYSLRKSNRVSGIDRMTGDENRLFHPRQRLWPEYFRWKRFEVIGRTAIGPTTSAALQLNDEIKLRIREAEGLFGLFPPEDK